MGATAVDTGGGDSDGAGGGAVGRSEGDDEITTGSEQMVVESRADRDIRLPCKFLDKVYSGAYSSTWIVEWEKTGRDGIQSGRVNDSL